jgi:pyroglutamyl-peptidase
MTVALGSCVRVLVTGFGPFPGIERNASEAIVRTLGRLPACGPRVEIATAVIPVAWAEARSAAHRAIAGFEPHAVLHFGVSKRAKGFEIETRAVNISGPKEDAAGVVRPATRLVHAGRPVLKSTLPPRDLLRALRTGGYPAALSTNAGRYLCNALFYWSLLDAEAHGRLVSFVHIPALGVEMQAPPRIAMDDAVAATRILVRAGAEAVLRAKPSAATTRGGQNGNGSQGIHGNGRRGGAVRRFAG